MLTAANHSFAGLSEIHVARQRTAEKKMAFDHALPFVLNKVTGMETSQPGMGAMTQIEVMSTNEQCKQG